MSEISYKSSQILAKALKEICLEDFGFNTDTVSNSDFMDDFDFFELEKNVSQYLSELVKKYGE